jgi:hypothetical protein
MEHGRFSVTVSHWKGLSGSFGSPKIIRFALYPPCIEQLHFKAINPQEYKPFPPLAREIVGSDLYHNILQISMQRKVQEKIPIVIVC